MGVTEIFSSIYGLKMKLGLVILLKGTLFQGYMIISVTPPPLPKNQIFQWTIIVSLKGVKHESEQLLKYLLSVYLLSAHLTFLQNLCCHLS